MTNQSVLERLRSTQYDVVCPCLDLRVAAADEIEGAHHDITSLMDSLNGEVNAAERLRGALEEAYRLLVYARADDELYDPPTWTEECDKWLDEFAPSKLRGAVEPPPPQNVGRLAANYSNADHALNCPCAQCKADPIRREALRQMREAQQQPAPSLATPKA